MRALAWGIYKGVCPLVPSFAPALAARGLGERRGAAARLALEQAARELADVAALDADLAQQLVDERRLRAVAERRVDDVVGEAAAAPVVALRTAAAPAEPVHLQDLDALDPLERPPRLADDRLEVVDELEPHCRHPRLGREDVRRLVHQACALGLHLVADARGERPDLLRVGLGLGLGAHRRAAVRGRRLLGLRRDR